MLNVTVNGKPPCLRHGFHAYEIQAYDSHCNLVLGDVEETIYIVEDDEDEEIVKVSLTACQPIKDPTLTRSCRPSRSSQRCSLSGVKHAIYTTDSSHRFLT